MNYTEKNRLVDNLCGAGLMLILTEVFYGIVDNAFTVFNYDFSSVANVVKIVGFLFFIISIVLFIRGYRKDKASSWIYGIEFFILAVSAVLLPGSYLEFSYPFNKLNVIFPIFFAVYYVIKALVIIIRASKNKSKGKRK